MDRYWLPGDESEKRRAGEWRGLRFSDSPCRRFTGEHSKHDKGFMRLTRHTRNVIYLFGGDLAARAAGFAATTYLARVLGASGFGIIHIGLAVLTYAMIPANSGLSLLGTRNIAAEPGANPAFAGRLLFTRFLLSLGVFALAAAGSSLLIHSEAVRSVTVIYLLCLFPAALMLDWYFQGRGEMSAISIGKFLGMLCYLAFILLFVQGDRDLANVAWGWAAGGLASAAYWGIVFLRKDRQFRFRWQELKFFSLMAEAFPLGMAGLISQVVIQFPALYLGWFSGPEEVGIFSAAFRLTVLLLIFDRVFYTMFLPAISRQARQSPEKLGETFNRVAKIVTVSTLTVGLAAIISADWIIGLVFGAGYRDAAPLFQILSGYFVLTLVISAYGYTLLGLGREKVFTRSLAWGMGVFFIAIFVLPRFFGIIGVLSGEAGVGVAAALVFYELTVLAVMAAELRKHIPLNLPRHLLAPFLGAFGICLPTLLLIQAALPLKLLLLALAGIPFIAWLGGVGKDEIEYIKKIFI